MGVAAELGTADNVIESDCEGLTLVVGVPAEVGGGEGVTVSDGVGVPAAEVGKGDAVTVSD